MNIMKNVINAGDTCILSNDNGYFEVKVLTIDLLTDNVEVQLLTSTNPFYPVGKIYYEQVKQLINYYANHQLVD